MQEFINFTLHYIADLDIPIKRSVCGLTAVLKESERPSDGFYYCKAGAPSSNSEWECSMFHPLEGIVAKKKGTILRSLTRYARVQVNCILC